jgi:hypothetical protein
MDKSHILAEIRRTAAANRGAPLGRQRFFAETGIKETDWFGKYWSRWGDAVKEAGLEPNRLQGAFSDEFLLDKLAGLVAELGHYPVPAELRLKARRDKTFPTHNTFARFGRKKSTIARLVAHCHQTGRHEDVVAICGPIDATEPEPEEPRSESQFLGFVYLLKSGRYHKVGRSNSVGRRERELAIQLPERAKMVHSIKTDDPVGIEAYWHARFEGRRKNGEWFELTADDVLAFKRRKFM